MFCWGCWHHFGYFEIKWAFIIMFWIYEHLYTCPWKTFFSFFHLHYSRVFMYENSVERLLSAFFAFSFNLYTIARAFADGLLTGSDIFFDFGRLLSLSSNAILRFALCFLILFMASWTCRVRWSCNSAGVVSAVLKTAECSSRNGHNCLGLTVHFSTETANFKHFDFFPHS